MPEKLIASSGATPLCYGNFAGQYEDGGTFFAIVTFNGGMGARRTRDGLNSITYPGSVANIPVEVIESESPLVFSCKEFAPHTAGPGRYRGGVGQKVVLRVAENGRRRLKGSIRASIRGSRYGLPVYGLAGGLAAGIEATAVFNNEPIVLGTNIDMVPGDTLEILVPGGGGYGPPLERSREDVERDLRDAMITVEAAETIYDYRRT
jgi:N-methylhydantoinase B